MIEGISAVTLGTHEMPRAVRFYRALGFEVLHGGEGSSFTSFRAGTSYLNLIVQPAERRWSWWGRVIFYVTDVDALYKRALAAGYQRATVPRDAEWGERFFHLVDPDGHEINFARPLLPVSVRYCCKSLFGIERKFLGPLMRLTRGDVRDHIVSFKINPGPSLWR